MILSKYRFFSEKILELFVYTYGITYVLLLVYDLSKDPYHMAHIIWSGVILIPTKTQKSSAFSLPIKWFH